MASYSYTVVPGKLKTLFEKIRTVGKPTKVDQRWFPTIGFKSSNDRSMQSVLKQIGFIDSSGTPLAPWDKYRGQGHKAALAAAIRTGYPELFSLYQDANTRNKTELSDFFRTKTTAGDKVVSLTVTTFQTLCAEADFSKPAADDTEEADDAATEARPTGKPAQRNRHASTSSVAVNINIQLQIPETTDGKVYDEFFAAMKRHLIKHDD